MSSPQPDPVPGARLESAHVLFMDIVAYSKLPIDQQTQRLERLQTIVRESAEAQSTQAANQLLRLPTGDGMALVFFSDPEAPVRCAIEISRALRAWPDLRLRMGVHTGPVQRVQDINANRNVAGGGINMAQRVMDCGDAGHILVSRTVADFIGETSAWSEALHDLGEAEVKHGVHVHIFNLYTAAAGNPAVPQKLRQAVRQRRLRLAKIAGFALAVLAAAVLAWFRLAHHPRYAVSREQGRRSVAVLGFKNLSGRPDANWISTALCEMLRSELSAGEHLRAVPGENVARMKIDLSVPDTDSLAGDTLGEIRRNLGSDLVVLGSYLDMGGQVRLDLNLQDTEKGETLASIVETGSEQQLLNVVSAAGAELRKRCGVGAVTSAEAIAVQATVPADASATRLYAEGLAKLRLFDARSARDLLQNAVTIEPGYSLAHVSLAQAWSSLGYDQKAASESKLAFEHSSKLPREDRLATEAAYRRYANDAAGAASIYQQLLRDHPDDVEYALSLAAMQVSSGHPKDALTTVAAMRTLPPPSRDDPRIDLAEASAANAISDVQHQLAAARAAYDKAERKSARLVSARAQIVQCSALRSLGQMPQALAACRAGQKTYEELGDRSSLASTLNAVANITADQGDFAGAQRIYEQVLATCGETGNDHCSAGALDNIASVMESQGKLREAQPFSERALALFRKVGDRTDEGEVLNNIAGRQVLMGNYSAGEKLFGESIALYQAICDTGREAISLNNMGQVQFNQGKLEQSRQTYDRTYETFRGLGETRSISYPLTGRGDVLFEQANLEAARKDYQAALDAAHSAGDKPQSALAEGRLGRVLMQDGDFQAARKRLLGSLDIYKQAGDAPGIADTECALAALELERGQVATAGEMARQAQEGFRKAALREGEIEGHTLLARLALAQRKLSEARAQLAGAAKLLASTPNVVLRLDYEIAAAEVLFAEGKPAAAVNQLKHTMAEAARLKFVRAQLEAHWALAAGQLASNQRASARAEAEALQREATERGMKLISNKAAALIKRAG